MKIYTRFGDKGRTRLLGGVAAQKSDPRIEMCGELDELNAALGLVISFQPGDELSNRLNLFQSTLFDAGALIAAVATDSGHVPVMARFDVASLEADIDRMQSLLPPLTNFIIPGGCSAGAWLHFSRAVCRRAERCLVRVCENWPNATECQSLLVYLNRLSDWLFVASRLANQRAGVADTLWKHASTGEG